jgi:hypothetical protein
VFQLLNSSTHLDHKDDEGEQLEQVHKIEPPVDIEKRHHKVDDHIVVERDQV